MHLTHNPLIRVKSVINITQYYCKYYCKFSLFVCIILDMGKMIKLKAMPQICGFSDYIRQKLIERISKTRTPTEQLFFWLAKRGRK